MRDNSGNVLYDMLTGFKGHSFIFTANKCNSILL